MFKKHVAPSSNHQLSGKDAKELKRSVLKQYPAVTEEQLAALLPNKAALTLTKMSNRSQVWSLGEGGDPLFFDPDGRGTLLPTVYALAVLPHMVPHLHTWSEVSPKVLGGADLFLQGVLPPLGGGPIADFLAGSVRALCVPGNPVPFAIGKMAVSSAEAKREGMKGRGLTLLHVYGDLLWQQGSQQPPNEGFTPQRIFPLAAPGSWEVAGAEGSGAGAGGGEEAAGADGGSGGGGAEGADDAEAAAAEVQQLRVSSSNGEAAAAGAAAEGSSNNDAAGGGGGDAAAGMDALLEAAVLAGLQGLTNAQLPIMTSDFYTKFMVPAKPEGVVFDMKQSKYKKLSKLLDKFEKDKVITQKVIRKQDHISAVNRSHPVYLAAAGGGGKAAGGGSAGGGDSGKPSGSKAGAAEGMGKASVEYCWRVPSSLRELLGPVAAASDKDRLYSRPEVEAALEAFAASNGLAAEAGGRRSVKLDRLLLSLFSRKEELSEGSLVPTDVLTRKLLDKLQQWHRLTRPSEHGAVEVLRKGAVKPVGVAAERRRGHNVTVVTRVESFALEPQDVAGVLQRKFQSSATVSKLPGKEEKDHEIMLQGDLVKGVAAFLQETYGIPPQFMEVKGPKPKK